MLLPLQWGRVAAAVEHHCAGMVGRFGQLAQDRDVAIVGDDFAAPDDRHEAVEGGFSDGQH
jgi:hypothetical protein